MPNHVHAVIGFRKTFQSKNTIIGNGKRFMACEIIKRLEERKVTDLLDQLSSIVETERTNRKKQHDVWKLSFDWTICETAKCITQKLDFFHNNPCKGKWNLCASFADYAYSSGLRNTYIVVQRIITIENLAACFLYLLKKSASSIKYHQKKGDVLR